MSEQVDVCIIGGGIMGLFCALELSQAGKVVRIIDKIFTGSSRHNIGAVLFESADTARQPFLKVNHDSWDKSAKEHDIDMGFEKRGSAFLAYTEEQANILKAEVENDNKHGSEGVSYEEDIAKLCEFLDVNSLPEDVVGAKISDDDNIVDTGKALDALRQLLIKNGVRFWGSDEVTEFATEGNKIISVTTKTGETCTAKEFLVTAGVWANKLLQLVDISVPMRPARCHLLHISPNGKIPQQLIAKRFPTGDIIIKYQRSGQVLVSYTGAMDQAQATWSNEVDDEAVAWVMEQLPTMLTGLSAPELNKVSTVTLAITQDGYPFLGRVDKYENLTVALGFSGKSYAYSAGTAKAVKAVVSNEEFEVDLKAFATGRKIIIEGTNLGNSEEEAVTTLDDKPDADPEVTMETGDKPESDADVTMEVGDKPEGDTDVTMVVGDKPESDADVTMEVGDKPEGDTDVTMVVGEKPENDTDVTMVVGEKPENDTDVTMIVGDKPESNTNVTMEVEGEEGTALGKEDVSSTKMEVEGGSALGATEKEQESSFVTDGDDSALGKANESDVNMAIEGDENTALGKEEAESKTKLTVEGGSALGATEKEQESSFVTDGESDSALGKEEKANDATMVVEGGSALTDDKEEGHSEMHIDDEDDSNLGLGAKQTPRKAKGALKVDESSNLGLGAKKKPLKSSFVVDEPEEEKENPEDEQDPDASSEEEDK